MTSNSRTWERRASSIHSEEHDLCMQPESATDGAQIYLQDCSEAPLQKFANAENGTIRLNEDGLSALCVAVDSENGIVINAIHKRRELSLRACEGTESTLITWSFTESGFWPES